MDLVVATKAFISHKGKVLLIRESEKYVNGTYKGKYDLPGGRIVPGETLENALKREVLEETGLDVKVGREVFACEWRKETSPEPTQVVCVFFESTTEKEIVKLGTDHDHFIWIDAQHYRNYPIIPNLIPAFKRYSERIGGT